MSKIGLSGLGNMGSGIVTSLLAKGYGVISFDVDTDRLTKLDGSELQRATSVSDISNRSELAVLCLPNPDIFRSVILEQLLVEVSSVQSYIFSPS